MTIYFQSLMASLLFLVAWHGLGRTAMRACRLDDEDPWADGCWALAMGAAISTLVCSLALAADVFWWETVAGLLVAGTTLCLADVLALSLHGARPRLLTAGESLVTELWMPHALRTLCLLALAMVVGLGVWTIFASSATPAEPDPTPLTRYAMFCEPAIAMISGAETPSARLPRGMLLLAAGSYVLAFPLVGAAWARAAALLTLLNPALLSLDAQFTGAMEAASFGAFALAAWWRAEIGNQRRLWLIVLATCLFVGFVPGMLLACWCIPMAAIWIWRVVIQSSARVPGLSLAWRRAFGVVGALCIATLVALFAPQGGTAAAEEILRDAPLAVAMLPLLLMARRLRGLSPLVTIGLGQLVLMAVFCPSRPLTVLCAPLLNVGVCWALFEVGRFPNIQRRATLVLVALVLASSLGCLFRELYSMNGRQEQRLASKSNVDAQAMSRRLTTENVLLYNTNLQCEGWPDEETFLRVHGVRGFKLGLLHLPRSGHIRPCAQHRRNAERSNLRRKRRLFLFAQRGGGESSIAGHGKLDSVAERGG